MATYSKKGLIALIALMLVTDLVVTGCGGGKQPAGSDSEETYEIHYGTWASDGEAAYEGMEKFKEIVEEESDGRIVVHLYPADQLGKTDEQVEQVSLGTIQMMSSGWFGLDEMEYLSLPYLMKGPDNWRELLGSDIGDAWNQELIDERGIRFLGLLPRSPRVLTADRPINTPEDMDGLKIRVPERDYYVETFKAFGARPTPMSFGEVYTALQTGVVNGQENPIETIYSAGFHEVQDYIILIDYMTKPAFVLINNEFYEGLPSDLQEIVTKAHLEGEKYAQELLNQQQEEYLAKMKEAGVEAIRPDLQPFIDATESVRENLGTKVWGKELYEKIKAIGQKDL